MPSRPRNPPSVLLPKLLINEGPGCYKSKSPTGLNPIGLKVLRIKAAARPDHKERVGSQPKQCEAAYTTASVCCQAVFAKWFLNGTLPAPPKFLSETENANN
jgi:hypothetical protein